MSAAAMPRAEGVGGAPSTQVDAVVVGGGPAGLSAALWIARYRRSVLLVDAGEPRNRWSDATHGYMGFDGTRPDELLHHLRRDLDRYGESMLRRGRVVNIEHVTRAHDSEAPDDGGGGPFVVRLDDGSSITARRLVLATGVRDVFPVVEGFERWFGTSVFSCPSCDGYEVQGRRVAVVGALEEMTGVATGLLDWAAAVVVVDPTGDSADAPSRTDDDPPRAPSEDGPAVSPGVDVVRGRPTSLVSDDEGNFTGIALADGRRIECQAVLWGMSHEPQSRLAEHLGCEQTDEGSIVVDEHGQTTVRGVFAAGDITPGPHLVQIAASKGAVAGIGVASSLRPPAPAPPR